MTDESTDLIARRRSLEDDVPVERLSIAAVKVSDGPNRAGSGARWWAADLSAEMARADITGVQRQGSGATVKHVSRRGVRIQTHDYGHASDVAIEAPNWSADGRWLVFNADDFFYSVAPHVGSTPQRIDISPFPCASNDHVLSPDGKLIYFSSSDGHLYRARWLGGRGERLTEASAASFRHFLHGISPDGDTLVFVGLQSQGAEGPRGDIFSLPSSGGPDQSVDGPPRTERRTRVPRTAAGSTSTQNAGLLPPGMPRCSACAPMGATSSS